MYLTAGTKLKVETQDNRLLVHRDKTETETTGFMKITHITPFVLTSRIQLYSPK